MILVVFRTVYLYSALGQTFGKGALYIPIIIIIIIIHVWLCVYTPCIIQPYQFYYIFNVLTLILQNSVTKKMEIWFVFQKMKYLYDSEEKKQFVPVSFPIDWIFKQYIDWKGYQDDLDTSTAEKIYGKNK